MIETPLVRRLQAHVDLLPVCPELEVGLGVPRDPIRLVRRGGATALVQPATGRDLTRAMATFAGRFLDALPEVDGFLLKARSPSCGVHGVKVFPDSAGADPEGREAGMFARAVLSRFPDHPAEHEGRLANPRLRDHFLTRLFALAELRRGSEAGTVDALVGLHQRHRLTRRTFATNAAAALDAICAQAERSESRPAESWRRYADAFRAALAPAPRESAHAAILREQARRVAGAPGTDELDALLTSYGEGTTPRWAVLARLRASLECERDDDRALDAYLAPYPEELAFSP
jgi:uncharacterized protein YbbK (DUF523 family)/uncharacterized protein YbgA (DUF1722 family)